MSKLIPTTGGKKKKTASVPPPPPQKMILANITPQGLNIQISPNIPPYELLGAVDMLRMVTKRMVEETLIINSPPPPKSS